MNEKQDSLTYVTQSSYPTSLIGEHSGEATPEKAVSIVREAIESGYRPKQSLSRLLVLEKQLFNEHQPRYETITFAGAKQDMAPLLDALFNAVSG